MHIVKAADMQALAPLFAAGWQCEPEVTQTVASILQAVRATGDAAVVEYTRRFDCEPFDESRLRVDVPAIEQARALVPEQIAQGLTLARERVRAFHERQRGADVAYVDEDATAYAFRSVPLGSVACYVPGGTAVLPSSVIMTAVPAKLAGVERVVVLTPPQRDGSVPDAILFACALCGVDEVYAAGGAQAVAAAAYGTATLAAVDKIVGPGNVFVTEAKRQLFGTCSIDGLAGPSEVLVVADAAASAEYVAGELLAQAEHDPNARVAAVSEDRAILERVARLLEAEPFADRERAGVIRSVLASNAFLIEAASRDEVFEVIDRFAPEHLSLQVGDPQNYLPHIRRAGAIFVGGQTPVAAGDYIAGTNHVLPTSGAARFSSGLRLSDFQRTFSVVENSRARMQADAPVLAALADFEGLAQHADTARMRMS